MIKFFRKIRQRMIKDNRISKYLLYAIGEIILVVIGILIALQINNWNSQRLERNEELKYLNKLLVDLEVDIKNLESLSEKRQLKIDASLALLDLPTPDTEQALIGMDSMINQVFGWREFSPRLNTLQELTSSGKFSILQNDSIKTILLNIEESNRDEATLNEHMKREFHYYLYDRAAVLRERNPLLDIRATLVAKKRTYDKQVSEEELKELYAQSTAFLNDLTLRNGLNLAIANNFGMIRRYEQMISERKRLIGFIKEDLGTGR